MTRYFEYATDAIEYLKAKDKKLGAAIHASISGSVSEVTPYYIEVRR